MRVIRYRILNIFIKCQNPERLKSDIFSDLLNSLSECSGKWHAKCLDLTYSSRPSHRSSRRLAGKSLEILHGPFENIYKDEVIVEIGKSHFSRGSVYFLTNREKVMI